MPFDGTDWAREERPSRPSPPSRGETVGLVLLALVAGLLVLLPVSMAALVDIVRYLHTG